MSYPLAIAYSELGVFLLKKVLEPINFIRVLEEGGVMVGTVQKPFFLLSKSVQTILSPTFL